MRLSKHRVRNIAAGILFLATFSNAAWALDLMASNEVAQTQATEATLAIVAPNTATKLEPKMSETATQTETDPTQDFLAKQSNLEENQSSRIEITSQTEPGETQSNSTVRIDPTKPDDQIKAVETATNDIVRLEIQLMKISTKFHLAWFTPEKGKSWRTFGYRIADSTLTNAGMICIATSRFKYINNPSAAPRSFLRSGHILNLIASSIMVGGTLTEATLDRLHDRRRARQGLSVKSSLDSFKTILSKLDEMMQKRTILVSSCTQLTDKQKAIIQADGLVLKDIRDMTCAEFAHSYCDVVRHRAKRDISNATALVGASTAGYLGSLNALLAVADRNPKQIGVAGIGFITSGSSVVASPMLAKLGSDFASKRAEKNLDGILLEDNEATRASLSQNRAILDSLISSASPDDVGLFQALEARNAIYSNKNKMFDSRHEFRANHRQKARHELIERQIYASIIGGTNIARGSQLAVAGFHYTDSPRNIFRLVASAATSYIAGSGVWTFDNLQGKAREEFAKANIKKAKLSVQARLEDDLESLEDMEDQMAIY